MRRFARRIRSGKVVNPADVEGASTLPRVIHPTTDATRNAFVDNTVCNSRYTAVTFLPLNIMEQFSRPLNFYFLLVACLQFIPVIAPVNPMSTLLPLLFAFTLTAVKEGYDDVKRHRSDTECNTRRFDVLRRGEWAKVNSMDIRVGDVLRLHRDEEIPCDGVCIASPTEAGGVVYIRTENLDGEIDLKPRLAVAGSPLNLTSAAADVERFAADVSISCPTPNSVIDHFDATMSSGEPPRGSTSMASTHLLLQSAYVKNTESLIMIAVYTGSETKAGMNKSPAVVKWALVDRLTSRYAMVIFAFQMFVALVFGVAGFVNNLSMEKHSWYLGADKSDGDTDPSSDFNIIIFPLRFFLLTSVMIPISFKFMVDMAKYYMALVLEWDLAMWDDERGEGMRVKNSGIVEDLAQIQYVLSDKTGTLTKNEMTLKGASVGGVLQWVDDQGHLRSGDGQPAVELGTASAFLNALALCNTVDIIGEVQPAEVPRYAAVSPDEEALCKGAAVMGRTLVKRDRHTAVLVAEGEKRVYRVVDVFAFTSERKCMSIVLEVVEPAPTSDAQRFVIISKGADERMVQLLHGGDATPEVVTLTTHITQFAAFGLRTLVVAQRFIPADELARFTAASDKAALLLEGRDVAIAAAHALLERDLSVVGASAVEDRLQDDVQGTVQQLLTAGVKVWMLTGDKVETAQQIAVSCGLFSPTALKHQNHINIAGDDWERTLMEYRPPVHIQNQRPNFAKPTMREAVMEGIKSFGKSSSKPAMARQTPRGDSYTSDSPPLLGTPGSNSSMADDVCTMLVQGGTTLDAIMSRPECREKFLNLAMISQAVVCARVTPAQKAAVTAMVKGEGAVTLSIGDGGNDVAMIQEAHVGVGIIGKEGQQAARAADFAITQFRHLATLMLVHGHMSYRRTCYIVQYSFYKSMLISFIQLAYNASAGGMSGVSFWNSFFLTVWNGAFTLPQALFYCLDRCVPRHVLLKHPALYRLSQNGYGLTMGSFFSFVNRGVAQSVGLLVLLFWMYSDYSSPVDGSTESNDVVFTVGYTTLLLVQVGTVVIESNSITPLNAIAIFGMPFAYLAVTATYSSIPRLQYYSVFARSMRLEHWLFAFVATALLFMPHYVWTVVRMRLWPNAVDIARRNEIAKQRRSPLGRSSWLRQWITFSDQEPVETDRLTPPSSQSLHRV
jgi:phospholipid-translocating ATPase